MSRLLVLVLLGFAFAAQATCTLPVRCHGIEQRKNLRSYYQILDAFKNKDYDSLVQVYAPVTLRWQNDLPVQRIVLPNREAWLAQFAFYDRSIETYNATAVNDRIDFCFLNVLTPTIGCGVQQKTSFCGMAYYNNGVFVGERFTGDLAPMLAWFASNFGCDGMHMEHAKGDGQLLGAAYGM